MSGLQNILRKGKKKGRGEELDEKRFVVEILTPHKRQI